VRNDIETFVGIDVGDESCIVAAVDRKGKTVAMREVDTDVEGLGRGLKKLKAPLRIAMEAGTHSPWMSAFLEEEGHEVIVGNPRKLSYIFRATNKQDRVDAEKLARLARADPSLLHPVYHRSKPAQEDLAIIRSRAHMVKMRTSTVVFVRGVVKSSGARIRSCGVETFARVAAEAVPEGLRPALEPMLELIADLTRRIAEDGKRLQAMAREKYPECLPMVDVYGVGYLTALAMVLILEDPARFRKSRDVGPALGLVPRRDQSGDIDKQLSITKTGDSYLRVLLTEAANTAMRPTAPASDLKAFGERIASRGGKRGKRRAITAVARKLGVLLHRLWVTQAKYVPVRNQVA
jgi:transposase